MFPTTMIRLSCSLYAAAISFGLCAVSVCESSPHQSAPFVCACGVNTPAGISSQLTDSKFPSSKLCPWVLQQARLSAVDFPAQQQQLVILNRSLFLRHWHVGAEKLQTEQSAFQTKPPNDKRHRSAERAWSGAFSLCLLTIGSSRRPVAECSSLGEQFSPGGFPFSVWQSRVAGHETRAQKSGLYPWHKSSFFSLSYPWHLLSCGINSST